MKLTVLTPEGTRLVGKPQLRWFESVEEDLKISNMRNWRRYITRQRTVEDNLVEAKVHQGL